MQRRAWLSASLTLLFTAALNASVQAQTDYPSRPVKLVIPFPAGGSSDGIGRQIADKLSGVLKQSVVVAQELNIQPLD